MWFTLCVLVMCFFFSSRRRHTRCALVTGVQTCALPIYEYELVRTIPETARAFLVKHGSDSVVVRLNLASEPDLLTVLSGRERTVRLLDTIRGQVEIGRASCRESGCQYV